MLEQSIQTQLEHAIADLLQEASDLGSQFGREMLGLPAERAITAKAGGFSDLLGRAKTIVAGVIGRLRTLIASALSQDSATTPEDVVTRVASYLPETVAETEVHSGVEQSAAEVLQENDVAQVMWVTQPDACPVCLVNEAQGPINLGEAFQSGDVTPPAHPRCKCNVMPVGSEQ